MDSADLADAITIEADGFKIVVGSNVGEEALRRPDHSIYIYL